VLGDLLGRLRKKAGLRLSDAGQVLDRSPATMSRIENGRLAPRVIEVIALLERYGRVVGIDDEVRERALELAGDARKEAWYSPFRDVMTGDLTPDHVQRLVEYETDAEEIRSYQVEYPPGLLQTAGYARAVADLFYPDSSEHERSRFVAFRLERQKRLQAGELRLRAVIRETAVRRVLAEPAVMAEQLERLADDIENGNPAVDLRILADTLALPQAMRGPFALMRFPGATESGLVYVESREGADYLENEAAIQRYSADFESLWNAALSKADALKVLEEVTISIA